MNKTLAANRVELAFEAWHTSSAVRARPYAYEFSVQDYQICEPALWFPEILMPLLKLSRVRELSKEQLLEIHVQHLINFLDYTTDLEITHVNSGVNTMTHGALSQYFTESEKCAALKLYTDEGYHALFSKEMAEQLAGHFIFVRRRSARVKQLDKVVAASPVEFKHLVAFVIAFVSETIIVQELSCLARSDLVSPVFHMFKDHLQDEAKHSVLFVECWVRLWSQLTGRERDFIVDLVIKVICIFCRPDTRFLLSILNFDRTLGRAVVAEMRKSWRARMPHVIDTTMKALRRTDVLDCQVYLERFKASGVVS